MTLRFEAIGKALRGYVDGEQKVDAIDSAYSSGEVGVLVLTAGVQDGHFDDFKITPLR